MPEEPSQQKPQAVGQYYIMEKVAQGGMAEIFRGLAYDVHGISQKSVCIKKILPHLAADREFIGSIIDEAKLAVKLVHGNIAQTYDLGKVGDDYYMVMEFVEGKTLSQIAKRCIARNTLVPIPFAAYFVSEVAQGLDYMHRRADESGIALHIVHRDISPQNIMVSFAGTVKIIDFGIAKVAFKAGATDSGMLKGKFAYMSPEQAYGDAIDHRSDIFSLGVILHELLTGKRLFKAGDSRETIRNVRRATVEPPSSQRHEIPDELDAIVLRALAKDRRHRYPFASEMRDDLVKFLHGHFPDFQSSDAAAFVRELFRDELNRPRTLDVDTKTPAFIIDRTNSALADDSQFEVTGQAKAPLDLGEFMLEEEPPPPPEAAPSEAPPPPEAGEPRPGARRHRPPLGPIIARALRAGLIAGAVAAVIAGTLAYVRHRPAPTAAPMPELAEAMIVTNPADAAVLLDGRPAGQGSPVTLRNIAPDEDHVIAVSKEGYATEERRVRLSRGEFASLSIALQATAPLTAKIDISSTPPGAIVFLDDRETTARTPATLEGLDTGRKHGIGLFLTGYKFWTKEIELKGGQARSFDIALARDMGSLTIDSDPPKSLVIIDGLPAGQTPFVKDDLEPDRVYRLEIWHEGYTPLTREIKGKAGARQELHLTLEPGGPPSEGPPPAPPKGGLSKPAGSGPPSPAPGKSAGPGGGGAIGD